MKKPKAPAFESEIALCEAFLASVDERKWTAYPETCGWDILMVRRADGFQIGVQAKLKLNTDVINQALEDYGHWSANKAGPDCRALLVPSSNGFGTICKYLALTVIVADPPGVLWKRRIQPRLPDPPPAWDSGEWPEWAPAKRHKLPDYVPDVAAGASAPLQLTDWKIKAIKLSVLLDTHGSVHRTDFAYLQLDHRRWIEGKWLVLENGVFRTGPAMPNLKKQHPKVYLQISAEFKKWADPKRPEGQTQGAML